MAEIALPSALEQPVKGTSLWRDAAIRLRRNPAAMVGLFLIGTFIFVAIFAPFIAPHSPTEGSIVDRFKPPSLAHPLGTDLQGRDILSRIIYGARASLWVAILSVTTGLAVGLAYGAISGFIGGWLDFWMMRGVDIVLALPGLLLTITIVIILGPGLNTIAFAIAIENVPIFARILRSTILGLKESDYTLAARAIGVQRRRILTAHILPNSLTPVIVAATLALATAIVDAAGLGFLGFGPQDPATPEWGTMLTDTYRYLTSGAAFTALFPGIAIILAVLGFNLLGDGLREALDPRLKR
jgi:peptide/nickel transport system permease protein